MRVVFAVLLVSLLLSCKGTPPPEDSPPEEAALDKASLEETSLDKAAEAFMDSLPDGKEAIIDNIDEPEIEFAETDIAPAHVSEEPVSGNMHEPDDFVVMEKEPPKIAEPSPALGQAPPPAVPPTPPAQTPAVKPAVPAPASAPAQTPVPAAPPLPVPPLLAPAEEKPPAQPMPAEPAPPKPETPAARETLLTPVLPQEGEIVFSRTIRATAGQLIEIPFRGTGWVYLGEIASRRGIVYDSRRLDPEGQSFVFRAEDAGVYSLKFYKQDFIRDFILNDYVQVIIGEAPVLSGPGWFTPPADRGRVVAEPRWPNPVDEAELRRGGGSRVQTPQQAQSQAQPQASPQAPPPASESVSATEASPPQTERAQTDTIAALPQPSLVTQTPQQPQSSQVTQAPQMPQGAETGATALAAGEPVMESDAAGKLPPQELLQKAKETFDDGKIAAAIALLDQFREYYPLGTDELYWLYGQFYEANSPSRDILLSLDYYRRLVREYPQSSRYSEARRRIAYLERFYINIQ